MESISKDLLLSGHNFNDYYRMFDLSETDLSKNILTVASGFDSFNQQMHEKNKKVISCAKNYSMNLNEISELVKKSLARLNDHISEHAEQYRFTKEKTQEWLREKRVEAAACFLSDYEQGKKEGRYLHEVLPVLHFNNESFDIALCSHFLFSHSAINDEKIIIYIKELLRVAREVRIFPLSDMYGELSPLIGPVLLALQTEKCGVEIKQVPYEFIRGGNALLKIWATTCEI